MTEPMVGSQELRPLFTLLFAKRFQIVALFILATVGTYLTLRFFRVATYESSAIVMVKLPLIDFDARIDPNPQIAPAFLDLAQSDGLLAETHDVLVRLREAADPLRKELGIEDYVTSDLREGRLPVLAKKPELGAKLETLSNGLEVEWQRELMRDYRFFLGLFEIKPEHIDRIPLFIMQESFKAKTGIVAQTNVSILNEPFLSLSVNLGTPGGSATLANIWGHLVVDRSNELTRLAGQSTEDSILGEAAKIEDQMSELQAHMTELRADPLYQKMREVEGLENSLYGGRAGLDLFGYVEAHADISQQSGLVGDLNRLKLKQAEETGIRQALEEDLGSTSAPETPERLVAARIEEKQAKAVVAAAEKEIADLGNRARTLRGEIADFEADFHRTEFQIQQVERVFSERLTSSLFSRSRLKSGYAVPPMEFAIRAVPDKHPSGPRKALLSLAVGSLVALFYICWVLYIGYLIPTLGAGRKGSQLV